MKRFVELIQRVHQERFSVVMNKIVTEKIPVAYFSIEPLDNAMLIVNQLRTQGINITTLITNTNNAPSASDDLNKDFSIVTMDEISKSHTYFEYVLVNEESILVNANARIIKKRLPNFKTITINLGNTEHIYQTFMNHLKDLQDVYESLIDEESKKTFCGYWLGRISNQFGELRHTADAHYLTGGFVPKSGSVIIDGGAFDGGTGKTFSQLGYKVYSFELDKNNFQKAKLIADENNFVVENMGLGSYNHEMHYVVNKAGSHVTSQGSEKAQIISIDSYVKEHNLPSVDFIKLDVEGAELDTLKGARTTITRFKPILAISAYHKWDDFWTLMNFVKSIRPDYEFALRHYPLFQEDEPSTFPNHLVDYLVSLGLEPIFKIWWECCLLAR